MNKIVGSTYAPCLKPGDKIKRGTLVRVWYRDTPDTEVVLVLEKVKVPKKGEASFIGYALSNWRPRHLTTTQVVATLGKLEYRQGLKG